VVSIRDGVFRLYPSFCLFVWHLPYPNFTFLMVLWFVICKKSVKIPKGGNQKPSTEEEQTIQWPTEKVQKVYVYRTLQRKQNIEQHEPNHEPGVNSVASEGHIYCWKIAERMIHTTFLSFLFPFCNLVVTPPAVSDIKL